MDFPVSATPELVVSEYIRSAPRIEDRLHKIDDGIELLTTLALAIGQGADLSEDGKEFVFVADALRESFNALKVAISAMSEREQTTMLLTPAPTRYRKDANG